MADASAGARPAQAIVAVPEMSRLVRLVQRSEGQRSWVQ
jgi:hypothetical protein